MSALLRLSNKELPDAEREAAAGELGERLFNQRTLQAEWRALCEVIHDEADSVAVRIAALRAIARVPVAAVNQLSRIFCDPRRLVRREAVALLRSIGVVEDDARLKPKLAAAAAGDSLVLANLALVSGYDPRIVAACRLAARNPEPRARVAAISCLAQLGEMADVTSSLGDPSPAVRAAAAESVGYYGTLEPVEIQSLQRALADGEAMVQKSARSALRRLGVLPPSQPGSRPAQRPAGSGMVGQWLDLLSALSLSFLEDEDYAASLDDEVVESGWLGRAGASDAEIADLSARLGKPLPPSYESFLRSSNGFGRISPFIDELWSTREVRPFAVDHAEWIEAYVQPQSTPEQSRVTDDEHRRYGDEQESSRFDASYLSTAVQISAVGDGVVLLNPQVTTSEGEWEAWFFANWLPGANRYRSFMELVRAVAAS